MDWNVICFSAMECRMIEEGKETGDGGRLVQRLRGF